MGLVWQVKLPDLRFGRSAYGIYAVYAGGRVDNDAG
jgi:hypothetical protein